jgi:hypothetical protein
MQVGPEKNSEVAQLQPNRTQPSEIFIITETKIELLTRTRNNIYLKLNLEIKKITFILFIYLPL